MDVERRPGVFVYVRVPDRDAGTLTSEAIAVVREDEGTTLVLERTVAQRAGLPYEFEAAWLTITAATALDAVGITARLSRVLADAGIAANVVAASVHDHVLVPLAAADQALALLREV